MFVVPDSIILFCADNAVPDLQWLRDGHTKDVFRRVVTCRRLWLSDNNRICRASARRDARVRRIN